MGVKWSICRHAAKSGLQEQEVFYDKLETISAKADYIPAFGGDYDDRLCAACRY